MTDFADLIEAGGEQTYPDGIPWTRQAIVTLPVSVSPATAGARVVMTPPFTWTDGNNAIQTKGGVQSPNITATIVVMAPANFPDGKGSVVHTGDSVNPVLNLTFINLYQGPGGQPNGVQAKVPGTYNVTSIQNAVAPDNTVPHGLPDVVVYGGGSGYSGTVVTTGMVEFDEAPSTGNLTITACKVLIGTMTENDWQGSVWHVALSSPDETACLVYNTAPAPNSLILRGTLAGQVTL